MPFPKLTPDQSDPLLEMARIQRHYGGHVHWFVEDSQDHSWFTCSANDKEDVHVASGALMLRVWADKGYVSRLPAPTHTFCLTQEALDYEARMRRRKVARWLLDLWDDSRMEVRSAIIAGVVSAAFWILGGLLRPY